MIFPTIDDKRMRVVILTPTGRDAALTAGILRDAGIASSICPTMAGMQQEIDEGAGAVLIAEEAIADAGLRLLADSLSRQEPWSDLPVLLLTQYRADSSTVATALQALGNVTLLERPVRPTALVSTLRTSLKARARQYQLRDHLLQQHRTSAELRESEGRLQAIFQQAMAGIAQCDLDGRYLLVNPRFCEITGYTCDELLQLRHQDLTHPDDRQRSGQEFSSNVAAQRGYVIEKRYVRKDGTFVWVRNSIAVMRDAAGQAQSMVAIVLDVTERKLAEALQEGQRRVLELIARGAALFEVLAAVCCLIEEQEQGLLCSILMTDDDARHTGLACGPSLPDTFVKALEGIKIVPPYAGSCCQALDCGQEVLVADIENDRRWSATWRELNLSHGLRACRSIPILGTDGKVLASVAIFRRQPGDPGPCNKQILGIATNLAGIAIERRRAEERERELLVQAATANAQFRAFFEQGALFAGIMHTDGTIIEPNRLCVEACGYTREQVIGKLFWECPWWSSSSELVEQIKNAWAQAAAGETFRAEMPYFIADGSQRIVDFILLPIKDEAGRVMFLAPTGTDITDRKRAVEELQESDRRKDEFLATLAHELRNPLAPIRNGLQVLRLAGANGEMAEEARLMMERQLGQMVHLIDDLLDLSRISRGKIELRKERLELAKVIEHAVEISRPAIEQFGHDLKIELPPGAIYVDADLTRLAQVFSNLLNNAAKYTERGGRIRLSMQRESDAVVVTVKDSGVGIPADMLPKVFEMFTQVDRNLERSQGGLGIGLSIVKRLVEMHAGSVEARSDGHGKGSEFVVRLPVVLSVVQPQTEDAQPVPTSSRRRILVVDDNRDAALSLAMMLKLMGNEARAAHDGFEALTVAAAFRPDLILLDIGMPGLNGYDTARRIREQSWGKRVLLVALTGWGQADDRRKSQEAGFDCHLVKPIEPAVLEKLLSDLKADTA